MTNKKNGPTPVGDVLGSLLAEARSGRRCHRPNESGKSHK